jgi:hypothetical protein
MQKYNIINPSLQLLASAYSHLQSAGRMQGFIMLSQVVHTVTTGQALKGSAVRDHWVISLMGQEQRGRRGGGGGHRMKFEAMADINMTSFPSAGQTTIFVGWGGRGIGYNHDRTNFRACSASCPGSKAAEVPHHGGVPRWRIHIAKPSLSTSPLILQDSWFFSTQDVICYWSSINLCFGS